MLKKTLTTTSLLLLISNKTLAQIVPDNSLPNNSTVINNQSIISIEGGTTRGTNLFHSFQKFSVNEGQTAIFNNSLDIQNIFSRVTGNSVSEINGILGANGIANLFLVNPNGIIFGENGSIAVGGSFFATTANKVLFADGFNFKTDRPSSNTILTVTRPVGLGINNPGQIVVRGQGHQLSIPIAPSSGQGLVGPPLLGGGESSFGLRTNINQTLSLIGGEINIDGGILTAFSGKIELASVSTGNVRFDRLPTGFNFYYDEITEFQDIYLSKQALLDASGIGFGTINLHGKNVSLTDGGLLLISNFANTSSGSIKIKATELVNIDGVNNFPQFFLNATGNDLIRGIQSQNFSSGRGADVDIFSKNIIIQNFGQINTVNLGSGEGGNVNLKFDETLTVDGENPLFSLFLGSISSRNLGIGKAGNILVSGSKVNIQNGGVISSLPFNTGEGGNIEIRADRLLISGGNPLNEQFTDFNPSAIVSNNTLSQKTGDIFIEVENLELKAGGSIFTNTNFSQNGSSIFISADSIEIDGSLTSDLPSQIASFADKPTSDALIFFFGLPPIPSGDAGAIDIETKNLSVSNGGSISVINEGTGNAGNININAQQINLDRGSIIATTDSGKGGNIDLSSGEIDLINNSSISATAGNFGDGGNIFINSDSLLTTTQSQITADAFQGRGGNIFIDTEVFITSNNSVLTATSQLGIDGVVEIETPQSDLENTIVPVKASILELDPEVAQLCLNQEGKKELLIFKPRNALRSSDRQNNPQRIVEPSLELLNLTDNLSEEQNKFYNEHLPPNAIIKSDRGIEAVNLCIRHLL